MLCTTTEPGGGTLLDMAKNNCGLFVHIGNCIVLVAINQTDMLVLRELSVGASVMGIAYNLLQPKPLVAPALWGCFFISCHMWQIASLLRERASINLNTDEELAYVKAFVSSGFTPRQFLDILQCTSGAWCNFTKGAYVQKHGEEMQQLHCALEGEFELISPTGHVIRTVQPGKGGWLGEFYDPNQEKGYWERPHPALVSWRCGSKRCRTLALERRALHDTLSSNPRLAHAAQRAEVADLWGKLKTARPQVLRSAYRSLLEVALSDGVLDQSERQLLGNFRTTNAISQEEHDWALEALGWSADDYARGNKMKRVAAGRAPGK